MRNRTGDSVTVDGSPRPTAGRLTSAHSWPFTGREDTLTELTPLLTGSEPYTLLLTGPAGVGKTRLVQELLAGPARPTARVLTAPATESTRGIPFGALAHLLPAALPASGGRSNLLRALADGLIEAAGDTDLNGADPGPGSEPVLQVDDTQLLDEGSAALLLHLAVRRNLRIVLTARSGVPLPDAVDAMVRGGYARRLELPPLTADSIGLLLERALGGPVESSTAQMLWQYSGGNVLWLQQLVEAGTAAGTLTDTTGVWQRNGPLDPGTELSGLVERRIGRLRPAVRRAAELLALGEPLGSAELEHLVGPAVLDELDHHGLATGESDGRRAQIRLAHPLYGEVLRQRMPAHRRRRHCRELADAVQRTGMRRRADPARIGGWRLAAGDRSDPALLLSAADHAVLTMDFTLAAELARAACAAGGGTPARRVLAVALGHGGQGIQAEQVHSGLPQSVLPEREQLRSLQLRAANMYLTLDRPADAVDLLRRGEEGLRDEEARAEVAALQAVLLAVQADWPGYTAAVERAHRSPRPGPGTRLRLRYAALVHAFCHGRTESALTLLESALPMLPGEDDIPMLGAGLMGWRATVQAYAGRLDEAGATAATEYRRARESGWVGSRGAWQFYLGRVAARRGALRTARKHMRDACAVLRDDSTWGQQGLLLGEWAVVEAQLGDTAGAESLLDRAHLARMESYRCFHIPALRMAQPWILAARGRRAEAVRQALLAAEGAREQTIPLWEAELLHLPVRLGRPAGVAARLATLATEGDAPHLALYAEHAAALGTRDAAAMERVLAGFDAAGMRLHAAETAAQAARLWSRRGEDTRAQRAADHCHRLTVACEGTKTPAVLDGWTPGLTERERDVARLAAAGHTSREIATSLGVAVRTVDNHLHRVYRKTGVKGRTQLAAMLTATHPEGTPNG
ncbi:helix-turn-helix transcriptional regulator [Streptomyces qinzhouensis]|uniref:AAA family ATPase n=1 Tax=Streptomyces qinzhouensis TaxID=2599401 RepID=A0A5B8JFE3_9ACTN|nr:LuxR family transcriptional regulator [Streptomyces qinzhouensis]QDY76173.1 AAA family ATPase [Streptomyces qinzhouensis]